jgi:hypothetical protein
MNESLQMQTLKFQGCEPIACRPKVTPQLCWQGASAAPACLRRRLHELIPGSLVMFPLSLILRLRLEHGHSEYIKP